MGDRRRGRPRNVEPNRDGEGLSDVDLAVADSTPVSGTGPGSRTKRHEITAAAAEFEHFYRANRGAVGRALALTLRDPDLASDAVDEAMARAYERWSHVETLENPVGWVYRVGLNWSRSLLRRSRRATPIWLATPDSGRDALGIDPAVDRALGELTVEQRAVVVCRLLLGYSEAQTADALDIRPGTVKSRLNRATIRLHVSLAHLHRA